jgi:hypothetical protein
MERDPDRGDLEGRFFELAARARRDHVFFLAGGAFISIVVAAGLSVVVYVLLSRFLWVLFGATAPQYGDFLPYYALAFIIAGYLQHRRALRNDFTNDEEMLRYGSNGLWEWLVPLWRFCVVLPALPFLLLHEAIESRHAFATRDAIGIAFGIISLGADKVPIEAVREKMRSEPAATRQALLLLRDMGFILLKRRCGEPEIVKTIRALEFLEESHVRSAS